MGKKKKYPVWLKVLQGGALALGLYTAGILLLSAAVIHGAVGEGGGERALTLLALAAVFFGGLWTAKQCPWAPLPASLGAAGCFALVLLGGGLLSGGLRAESAGHAGVLLGAAAAGGILGGIAGKPMRRRY